MVLMLLTATADMTVKMGREDVGLLALTISVQQWKGLYWDVKYNILLLSVLLPFR